MPEWRPWTRRQIAWHSAGDMNCGEVKCKRVDVAKWMAGVTQVVFWCGVSQQGSRAKKKCEDAQAKGKSKGGKSTYAQGKGK